MSDTVQLSRRSLLQATATGGAGLALAAAFPAWAQPLSAGLVADLPSLSGEEIALTIGAHPLGCRFGAPAPKRPTPSGRDSLRLASPI